MEERVLFLLRDVNPYADVESNTRLLEDGVIDSLRLLVLIELLEREFVIKIPEGELKAEHFIDVRSICSLVEQVQQGS